MEKEEPLYRENFILSFVSLTDYIFAKFLENF